MLFEIEFDNEVKGGGEINKIGEWLFQSAKFVRA